MNGPTCTKTENRKKDKADIVRMYMYCRSEKINCLTYARVALQALY